MSEFKLLTFDFVIQVYSQKECYIAFFELKKAKINKQLFSKFVYFSIADSHNLKYVLCRSAPPSHCWTSPPNQSKGTWSNRYGT